MSSFNLVDYLQYMYIVKEVWVYITRVYYPESTLKVIGYSLIFLLNLVLSEVIDILLNQLWSAVP